jgi:cell division protease FtsH
MRLVSFDHVLAPGARAASAPRRRPCSVKGNPWLYPLLHLGFTAKSPGTIRRQQVRERQGKLMDASDKRFGVFAGCVVAVLLAVAGINLYQAHVAGPVFKPIPYSEFLDDLNLNRVRSVEITGKKIVGFFADGSLFQTYAADDPDLVKALRDKKIRIVADAAPEPGPSPLSALGSILPLVIFAGLMLYFMRRQGAGGAGNTLGKSRARLLAQSAARITFEDVAGVDEAKESLQEIVDYLRDPATAQRLGGRVPHGVLLVGPPGTGKTLLARAVAGEANAPFFTISGSDFVEMFVGVGASRVRDMFAQAKKNAPCIIFMDEIDAVGRKRGAGVGNGNDEREQTLNQLLVEMDGFDTNEGVILIAATNRPDVLDPALLRPGRFDREVVVSNPDIVGREQILEVHVRKIPLGSDVNLKAIARRTPGFSGADLMNLVNEAALLAARRGKDAVAAREFEDAKDTVTMGVERRTHVMTEDEKRLTAYREGGRAVVALHVTAADPVHKATIITRGRSSGQVKQLPEDDQEAITLEQMTSRLAILMAGRAAEEMTFGRNKVTSGSVGDIDRATRLARDMVTRWGLSEALGAVAYGDNQEEVFLGNSISRQNNVPEQTGQVISVEVRKLVDGGLAEARRILTEHNDQLKIVAEGLMRYETLSGDEISGLIAGKAPVRDIDEPMHGEAAV